MLDTPIKLAWTELDTPGHNPGQTLPKIDFDKDFTAVSRLIGPVFDKDAMILSRKAM